MRDRILPATLASVMMCAVATAQWITFTDQTATRISFSQSATDPEEKDFALADLNQDGLIDLVVARKEGFYGGGARTHVLLMNVAGVLTDQTATYAPGFISSPSLARVVVCGDFDGDTWVDAVIANTNGQQPQYYKNLGEDAGGNWLGLQLSAGRIPNFSPGPLFCSAAAGDVDGDGDLDLWLGDYNNTLENRLCINNGLGFFADESATRFAGGIPQSGFSVEAAFADFNADGALDIMDTQAGSTGIHMNMAGGVHGQFTARIMVNGSGNYTSAVGDLNNDGKPDIYAGQDPQDAYLINTTATGSLTPTFTTITLQSTSPGQPNYSPHTTGFAGNPYIVDLDNDGYNDLAMADTDVDVPGCARRAVLTQNIFPTTQNTAEVLTTPYGSTLQNFNTLGTHDVAVFDVDMDGSMDVVSGLCVGYRVFIQVPPIPIGFNVQLTAPTAGALNYQVVNATPNAPLYNFFSFTPMTPAGSGPFFGLHSDAFALAVQLYPLSPIFAFTDANGSFGFSLPGGTLWPGFALQTRSIQINGLTFEQSNVATRVW